MRALIVSIKRIIMLHIIWPNKKFLEQTTSSLGYRVFLLDSIVDLILVDSFFIFFNDYKN